MAEFMDWWMGFGYFKLPSWQNMGLYLLIAVAVVFVRWLIKLRCLYLPIKRREEAAALQHKGEEEMDIGKKIVWVALSVLVAPFVEEFLFRAPILWFVISGEISNALLILCLTTVIFAVLHKVKSVGRYKDGTNVYRNWYVVASIAIGGMSYGFLVMFTGSIWPAVLAHGIWNLTAGSFKVLKLEPVFDRYAYALQR